MSASIWTPRRKPVTRPQSILLVDDHELGAQAVAAALSIEGHQVRGFLDGTGALETSDWWTPDLAILDINMPRPDGFELAMCLRRRTGTRNIYLIALTSMAERDVRSRGMQAGFDAFCRKGVGAAPILDIVSFCR
jgi:CheY-like chemotaxis protein